VKTVENLPGGESVDQVYGPEILGPRSRTAVALLVLTEVAKRAEGPLFLAELNTGDGLYRSLALVADSGQPVVQVNLIGDSASAADEVLADIWPIAAGNPRLVALMLLSEGDLPAVIDPDPAQVTSVTAMVRLASLLTLGISRDLTLTWGWADSTYGAGPHPILDEFTSFPEHWITSPGEGEHFPWQGHIFVVSEGKRAPLFAINVTLDEAVAPDGAAFDGFPRELRDEEGLPIAAIGARLTDEDTGEVLQPEVHASMARYAAKLLMEERLSVVTVTPLFELATESESIAFWNIAEGIHGATLSDYLD
jgi:hypothetical protein